MSKTWNELTAPFRTENMMVNISMASVASWTFGGVLLRVFKLIPREFYASVLFTLAFIVLGSLPLFIIKNINVQIGYTVTLLFSSVFFFMIIHNEFTNEKLHRIRQKRRYRIHPQTIGRQQ